AAKGGAGLHACVGLLDGNEVAVGVHFTGEGIARLKGFIAKVSEKISVEIVAAAFRDDVDDAAGGTAIFGIVVADDDLEFLDGLLRNGGPDTVDGVVDGICTVHADHIAASTSAAEVETGVGRRTDGRRDVACRLRICKSEIDVAAAVDRKVVDL